LTFFRVISNWRKLFFSWIEMGWRSRSSSRVRRSPIAVEASIPVMTVPSAVAARKRNFGNELLPVGYKA